MSGISPETYGYVRDLVYKRAAIVVEPGKEYLVEARLGPVARQAGLPSIDELVRKLRSDERGPLVTQVVEAMTTNETSFFRDVHPFESLRTKILPEIVESRAASRQLRIWCAAASTGQEPYSIAMTIREHFPQLDSWNVSIVATDINATVLGRARAGIFRPLEVNRGLPAPLLVKYFEREGADWRIKTSIRQMVSFQEMNLLDPQWPIFGGQDVVFIRNVLIYFDVPTKRTILGRIRRLLRPDGYLFLGGAETTVNIDDEYQSIRVGQSLCYQAKSVGTPGKVVANAAG